MSIRPPEQLTEAELLDQEIRMAKRAMQQARAQLKDDARRLVDPRLWIQQYPVASTLVACFGGALLARGVRKKARHRVEVEPEVVELGKKAARKSPFVRDVGAALRKSLVGLVTSGLVSRAASAFQEQIRPEAAYSGFEGAPEPAPTDVGGQI